MAQEIGRNIVFPIYNADGTPFHDLVIRKATYDEVVMSLGRKIVGDVYYKSNTLDVAMTEYIEYNGVQYKLVNPPTVVKEGMVSDNGDAKGMTKYSFTFYHPEYELSNLPFTDIAVDPAEIPYKSQDKTFYWIGNLIDFIAKLNANLVGTQWIVRMTGNEESAEKALKISDVLTFDKVFIADALKTAYDTWEIPYTVDKLSSDDAAVAQGKMFAIYFGKPSNEIYEDDNSLVPFVFKCGQGLGLKNDSRTPKNNKIVTRIVGHGSEDNIPYGYPQIRWHGDDDASFTYGDHAGVYENVTIGGVHFDKVVSYPIYEGIVNGEWVKLIKHPFTRKNLMPSVYAQTVFNNVSPYLARTSSTLIVNTNYDPDTELIDYYDAIDEQDFQYVNNIDPNAPSVEFHEFEDIKPKINPQTALVGVEAYNTQEEKDKRSAESISEADFLEYLEQEEQWCELSLLVEDQNALTAMAQAYNVGENASYEKNGGATNVKWTLTFTNGACIAQYRSSTPIAFDYYVVEEVSTSESESESESVVVPAAWDDTMDANGEYRQSYFKATLPTFNFDLYACASITQEMKLYMRSGACQGCTFEVMVDWDDYKKNFYDEDGNFDPIIGEGHPRNGEKYPDSRTENITVIVKKDLDTFGVLMPNTFQMIAAGDTFAILGISLPESYIEDAEQELDEAMKEYMLENNVYYFDYPLKFDEYFFAKHPFILEQMRMNTIVRFDYANEPTKVLYVKQMTIKWGVSPLPQYSITLTDDIEVVLNQIGRTTEDVSRLRVQMSEIQKYYGSGGEGGSGGRNEYLSRIMDDVAAGRITFQQGLDALGRVIFSDDIYSNGFVSGMDTTGRGWRIDRLGNAELESLRVRSFLEVIELLVNRLQAQEGDTLFTDNDQIEYVEVKQYNNDNTYYKLTLKEKWEGYFTALNFAGHTSQQSYGVIIKGIINTLAANAGNVSDVSESDCRETDGENKYYTSWMRVIEPSSVNDSVGANQICVILYADDQTPARKNFPPCELMTIARWGCEGDTTEQGMDEGLRQQIERRQRLFSISVTDGRISKLRGVNKPILEEWNYGTTLGILPEFINDWSIRDRLIKGRDYLYAQGIVVGDFIKVDIHGAPLTNYVDCGEWVNGGAQGVTPSVGHGIYLHNEYNDTSLQWETHDVWHNGSYWRCLRHQPVETTTGGVTTYEYREPSTANPNDWLKLLDSGSDGTDGTSPLVADLDNEMDSVSCDEIGRVITARTISTNVTLYNGNATPAFTITSIVRRFGTSSTHTWTSSDEIYFNGVQVTWSGSTPIAVSIAYNEDATITGRDEFTINTQVTIGGVAYNRSVKLIVNGVIGDVYNLLPNTKEINTVVVNGSYTCDGVSGHTAYNLRCGYTKNVNGNITTPSTDVTGQIDSKYNIYFRRRTRLSQSWSTYYLYTNTTYKAHITSLDLNTYDAVQFVLSTSTTQTTSSPVDIIDRETVYVIAGGQEGDKGEDGSTVTYVLTSTVGSYTIVSSADSGTFPEFTIKPHKYVNGEEDTSFTAGIEIFRKNGTTYEALEGGDNVSATTGRQCSLRTVTRTDTDAIVACMFLGAHSESHSGYVAELEMPVYKEGKTGGQGSVGRIPYYAGIWEDMYGQTFTATDTSVPYFAVRQSGGDETQYNMWLWVGANGTYNMNSANTPSSSSANWELMTNDFKYIITEALLTDRAKLGAAIFNQDWMYSQYSNKVITLFSGDARTTTSAWTQIGMNVFNVVQGRKYIVYVTAYVNSGSGYLKVFYGNEDGNARILIKNTNAVLHEMAFTSDKTGTANIRFYANSGATVCVSKITVDYSDNYTNISPSFMNDDTKVLYGGSNISEIQAAYRNHSSSDTSYTAIIDAPQYLVANMSYEIVMDGMKGSSSSANFYVQAQWLEDGTRIGERQTFSSTSRATKTWTITPSTSGWAVIAWAFVSDNSSNNANCMRLTMRATNPFIPMATFDWFSGYAHFAGGNARFYPNGTMFIKNIRAAGFMQYVPQFLTSSNVGDFFTSKRAWRYYSASAGAGSGDDVQESSYEPWQILDLGRSGNSVVIKTPIPQESLIHLPFIVHVWGGTDEFYAVHYDSYWMRTSEMAYEDMMYVRSFIGSSIEIYNCSGENILITGMFNKYGDYIDSTHRGWPSAPLDMTTSNESQTAVSSLHTLASGKMLRLTCKRLNTGTIFETQQSTAEIVYWDIEGGFSIDSSQLEEKYARNIINDY